MENKGCIIENRKNPHYAKGKCKKHYLAKKGEVRIKPMSINEAWQGRRFKSKKYTSYSTAVLMLLPELRNFDKKKALSLNLVFGVSSRGSDLDNLVKPFLDLLQTKYKFNDNQIYRMILEKEIIKKGEEFIRFKFHERNYETIENRKN